MFAYLSATFSRRTMNMTCMWLPLEQYRDRWEKVFKCYMYISVKSLSRYLLKIIANIKLHPLSNVHDCVAKIFAHRLHARYIIQILVRIYQFMYCIKIEFLILFCVILFSYLSYGKLKKNISISDNGWNTNKNTN